MAEDLLTGSTGQPGAGAPAPPAAALATPAAAAAPADSGQVASADVGDAAPPAGSAPGQPGEPGVGSRVAGYRLEERIGAGGMAVVYRALDVRLGRQVALKLMAPVLAGDHTFRQRFLRESRAASAVDEPHILPVYEADQAPDGTLFIATRYVQGGDLRTLLSREGTLSFGRVADIVGQTAAALDAAHALGLVHRDVKPSNILLDERGSGQTHVYLTDFGLSKAIASAKEEITQENALLGTIEYMAPEQISGAAVSASADQYSLASTAFHMLSGRALFRGASQLAVMYAQINSAPPQFSELYDDVPAGLDAVFAIALAKDPASRYPSCGRFAEALQSELSSAPSTRLAPLADQPETAAPRSQTGEVPPVSQLGYGPPPHAGPSSVPGTFSVPDSWPSGVTYPPGGFPPPAPQPYLSGPPYGTTVPPYETMVPPYETMVPPDSSAAGPSPDAAMLDVAVQDTFRYIHEPVRDRDDVLTALDAEMLRTELTERIQHSRGGTFLITGFRGVGKSSLVLRAVDEITRQHAAGGDFVLPVYLSVARATTTERLLFAVVRRVFEAVNEKPALLSRLPPETRQSLLIAYMRTSLAFKETQADARERGAALELGGMRALASLAIPKVSMSAKRTRSLATEAAFLAYSETDVEHDLMRIVKLVNKELPVAPGRRLLRRRSRHTGASARPHLIIVLDEVDKLTLDRAGLAAVEDLLSGIKNVLTMPGAHFLVVAGPDLHDRAVRDAARGSGIYESVFGWRMYVPCNWDAPEQVLRELAPALTADQAEHMAVLARYLRFRARGVPRRLLQEINGFVGWVDGHPRLRVADANADRVRFYARLEGILSDYFDSDRREPLFRVPIDRDRWRLGGYFVLDWVLQSEGAPFSAADLLPEEDDAQFDPLLRIGRPDVERLLAHLAEHDIVSVVREMNAQATIIGDVAESSATVYQLHPGVLRTILGLAAQHEVERAALDLASAPWRADAAPGQDGPSPARRVIGGRYELADLIGQGSMGSVYRAVDLVTSRTVAVKLLRTSLSQDPVALSRLQREAELVKSISHPQVSQIFDILQEPDGGPVIVMELLHGRDLGQTIAEDGLMHPPEVAALGVVLSDALQYLAGQGVVRLDLKPNNVIMAARGPVIVDLGIAVRPDAGATITQMNQIIGTPAYMAPEMITGSQADQRSDQYSLALVLYFCLAGRGPWDDLTNAMSILSAVVNEPADCSQLPISPEFRQTLSRALAKAPADRFPDAAAFSAALKTTPEWRSLGAEAAS